MVWRTNAVLIFLAALIVIVAVGWLLIDDFLRDLRRSQVTDEPVINDPSVSDRPLHLRSFVVIKDTGAARADLVAERTSSGISSSGGTYDETHNVLWINLTDGKSRWLLPNHKDIVTFSEDITTSSKDSQSTTSEPLAALFLVKKDVPQIESSSGTLIITSPSGQLQEIIASDVRSVEGWDLLNPSEVVIVYGSTSGYRLLTVNLSSLQKVHETALEVPK